MVNDTIVSFTDPAFRDELSDLVREGARRIVAQAVEAELKGFLEDQFRGPGRAGPASGGAQRIPAAAAGVDGRRAGDGTAAEDT